MSGTQNKPTPEQMLALKYPGYSAADRERIAARARESVARHHAGIDACHEMLCEMAFGNVSLAARASMAPVADFVGWMRATPEKAHG